MSDFAEIFLYLLKTNRLSYRETSRRLKISSSQLSKYGNGIYEPSIENLVKISNYFNCSIDYLLGLDKTQNRFGLLENQDKELFIKRLNELILTRKTNINRICKNLYLNRNTFYNWKNLRIFPKISILSKLAKELNTYVEYLIGRTNISEIQQ